MTGFAQESVRKIVQLSKYSMIQGPPLSEGQFAVSMADGATGHVLTTEGEVYHSDGEETFWVFDSLEAARRFIKGKQNEDDTVEFYIYDFSYKFLECWEARKWKR